MMFKTILIVLVALFIVGGLFGEDEDTGEASANIEMSQTEESTPNDVPSRTGEPSPTDEADVAFEEPTPSATSVAEPKPRTYLVAAVVDGDTIELTNGDTVRIVGIDTPERGRCGYAEATRSMERMVLGKRVRLAMSDEETDNYDRLLRYVNVATMDVGLRQIKRGLANARYDSRDGYGFHVRENRYIAADKASKDFTCVPKPKPQPLVPQPGPSNCAVGYSPCVPPYPPDLDCADVGGPIYVTGSDPHGLDRDGDGVACES